MTTRWSLRRARGAMILTVALSGLVAAPALAAGPNRPWADGVSADNQREADTLFRAGMELVKEAFFTRGVEQLRASAALWDHPATHFNLAKALMNLGDPAAALEHLWRAMRHGGAPLRADHIEQAHRHGDLLFATEVAHVVVRSDAPNVRVTIGDAPLLDGPGARDLLLASATPRTLVATVDGAEVARVERTFAPGKRTEVVFSGARGATPRVTERAPSAEDMRALERAIVGFEVPWPPKARLAAMVAEEQRRAKEMAAATPDVARPTSAASKICERATKGDLATVCRDYEALYGEVTEMRRRDEQARRDAERRLEELTRGGVVDSLD